MPFRSEKQRRFLWAKHPEIAKEWAHKYPESNKNLPMYAKDDKDKNPEKDTSMSKAAMSDVLRRILVNNSRINEAINSWACVAPVLKSADSKLEQIKMPQSDEPSAAGERKIESILKPETEDEGSIGQERSEQVPQNPTNNAENPLLSKLGAVLAPTIQQELENIKAQQQARDAQRIPNNANVKQYPVVNNMIPPPMGMTAPPQQAPAQPQQQTQQPNGQMAPVGGGLSPNANPINSFGGLSSTGDINGNAALGTQNMAGGEKMAGVLDFLKTPELQSLKSTQPIPRDDQKYDWPAGQRFEAPHAKAEFHGDQLGLPEGYKYMGTDSDGNPVLQDPASKLVSLFHETGDLSRPSEKKAYGVWDEYGVAERTPYYDFKPADKLPAYLTRASELAAQKGYRLGFTNERYGESIPGNEYAEKLRKGKLPADYFDDDFPAFFDMHPMDTRSWWQKLIGKKYQDPKDTIDDLHGHKIDDDKEWQKHVDENWPVYRAYKEIYETPEKPVTAKKANELNPWHAAVQQYIAQGYEPIATPDGDVTFRKGDKHFWWQHDNPKAGLQEITPEQAQADLEYSGPFNEPELAAQKASAAKCSCGCGQKVNECTCPPSCSCRQKGGSCYGLKKQASGNNPALAKIMSISGEPILDPAELDELESEMFDKKAGSPAWQRSEGKNEEGGLNAKGRASYNNATGGNLKAPVTESNPSGERAKRQNSFCSRMCGMKRVNTGASTAKDPDSRINKSLRKWNCKCGSAFEFGAFVCGYMDKRAGDGLSLAPVYGALLGAGAGLAGNMARGHTPGGDVGALARYMTGFKPYNDYRNENYDPWRSVDYIGRDVVSPSILGAGAGVGYDGLRMLFGNKKKHKEEEQPEEKQAMPRGLQDIPAGSGPDQIEDAILRYNQLRALVRPDDSTLKQYGLGRPAFQQALRKITSHSQDKDRFELRKVAPNPGLHAAVAGISSLALPAAAGYFGGPQAALATLPISGAAAGAAYVNASMKREGVKRTAKLLKQYGLLNPQLLRQAYPLLGDDYRIA